MREVKIDRAVYLLDDEARVYRFLRRNPRWQVLAPGINDVNKRSIDGYASQLRNGLTKTYLYKSQSGAIAIKAPLLIRLIPQV